MLLEFRVRNFCSIRDEQALSLVAAPSDKELAATHLAPTGLKALPQAVRSAMLYGPDASGKSTLLFALSYLRAVVAESATVSPHLVSSRPGVDLVTIGLALVPRA